MIQSVAFLVLVAMASTAGAAPYPAEIAAARQLARQGFRLANEGRCLSAVDPLSRAELLFHAPTVLVRLAECHLELGKLVLGTEELRRVTVEDLGPSPNRAFVNAKARARSLLAEAEPRLGHITIHVTGPDSRLLSLHLDGETVSSAMVGVDIPVDPGLHRVRADAVDFLAAEASVAVAEGGSEQVALELAPAPVEPTRAAVAKGPSVPFEAVEAGAATSQVVPAEAVSVAATPSHRVAALAVLVAGAAGLGVGVGFGVAALNDKARLDRACVNEACPMSSRIDLIALQRDATISNVGWAVGAAASVLSAVLFLLSPRGGGEQVLQLVTTRGGVMVRW